MERKVDKIIVIRAVGRMVFEKTQFRVKSVDKDLNEAYRGYSLM